MLDKDLYYEKYLKYKNKYLNLQGQIGGMDPVYQLNGNNKVIINADDYFTKAYYIYINLKASFWHDDKTVSESYNTDEIWTYSPVLIPNLFKVNFEIYINPLLTLKFTIEKNNNIITEYSFVILTDKITGTIYILSNKQDKLIEWEKYVNSDKFHDLIYIQ
jgi:hypothetical protein